MARIGESKKAEAWLRKAIDYDPGAPTLYLKYGKVLADERQLPKAIDVTRKAVELAPDDYMAALQLGDLFRIADKPDEAGKSYRNALNIDPSREDAYLALAYLYRARNKSREGLEQLNALEKIRGDLPVRSLLLRSSLYKDLDEPVQAEKDLLSVLDEYPHYQDAQKSLLDLYLSNGDLEQTADHLEDVYQEHPWMTWIPEALVELYARLGNVEAINNHLRARNETDPVSAEQLRLAAVEQLAEQREYDKAMSILGPLLSPDSDNKWAWFYAGFLYSRKSENDKALEMYRRIPVTSELYTEAIKQRAATLVELKRTDDAIALLQGYLKDEPEADEVRYTLISVYVEAKQYENALKIDEEILSKEPGKPRACR
jgi:tetratricopeptide (TPR) repeat protein